MKTLHLIFLTTCFSFSLFAQHNYDNQSVIYSNNGNVGIGLSQPSEIVHIMTTSTPNIRLGFNTDAENHTGNLGGIIFGKHYDTRDVAKIYSYTDWADDSYGSADLRFATAKNNTLKDQLIIKSDGKVGIGTLDPDAKLAVKGDIHTQEVKVDLNGAVAPDYVFEPDYNLRTLAETEAYIKANKHLPEIPSAAEMEENGMELKAMNLKLLQKIEELTLYTIAQQKLIKTQTEQYAQQQKEIQTLKRENKALKSLSERLSAIEEQLESKK